MIEHEVAMAIHELRNIRSDKRVQKALAWLQDGQHLMTMAREAKLQDFQAWVEKAYKKQMTITTKRRSKK